MCLCCGQEQVGNPTVIGVLDVSDLDSIILDLKGSKDEDNYPTGAYMGHFYLEFEQNGIKIQVNGLFNHSLSQNDAFTQFGIEVKPDATFNNIHIKYTRNERLNIIVKYKPNSTLSESENFVVIPTNLPEAIWTENNL